MSYIRPLSEYRYVKGNSNGDYVYPTYHDPEHTQEVIEDYGGISDGTLLEFVAGLLDAKDNLFRGYVLRKLAERLKVELREKPLTDEQIWDACEKRIKEFDVDKEMKKVKKEIDKKLKRLKS